MITTATVGAMDSRTEQPRKDEADRVVVVADDDADVRATLAETLERHGFTAHQAANGLEAILAIKTRSPVGVVLDLLMPRLGGLEALNRIRAFAPTLRVVVITGAGDRDLRREALLLGATAVFSKPLLTYDALIDALAGPATGTDELRQGGRPSAPAEDRPAGEVLIADDDAQVKEMLRDTLERIGYRVLMAADGEEAVRLVKQHRPRAVLMDIVMPGMDGIEALITIKGIAPETPVIMMSGTSDVATARRSLAYGAFDYLAKPVDIGRLRELMAAAFILPAI